MSISNNFRPSLDNSFELKQHNDMDVDVDIEKNAATEEQPNTTPTEPLPLSHPSMFPEGGRDAWLALLGAFCCLFCSFGWINCVGVFQNYYQSNQLKDYTPSTVAWITSCEIFIMFFPGPIVGFFYDNYGPRYLLIFGTFMHVFGIMMTSLSSEYYQFILSQGICSPLGLNCIFNAGASSVPTWFFKKRGAAYGVMAAGSGLGGIIFPIMASHLIPQVGFGWAMRICAFLILALMIVAMFTVRSRLPPTPRKLALSVFLEPFTDIRFNLLTFSSFLFFMAIFIPINFIEVEAIANGMSTTLASYLLAVLNAASIFGRIIPGILADKLGRFNMQMFMAYFTSILVLAVALTASNNAAFITFAAFYGFASGAFVSLAPAQIAMISKIEQIGIRLGVMFSVVSFAGLVGSPIAGQIVVKDHGAFDGLNIFAGVLLLAGAVMFTVTRMIVAEWKIGIFRMPKLRQTCTRRCSMRRQKCDKKKPCSRCVLNKESHLCTTEWTDGYNPNVHRKYPRKASPAASQSDAISSTITLPLDNTQQVHGDQPWSIAHIRSQELPSHIRSQDSTSGSNRLTPSSSSYSTPSSISPTHPHSQTSTEPQIDFITFGRSQFADVSMGSILASKDDYGNKIVNTQALDQSQSKQQEENAMARGFSPQARTVEIFHIQSLLPAKHQVFSMTDYHEAYMLYWSGGVYHAPSFRKSLIEAYGQSEELELRNLDWRWTALLFSILSACIIGSPETVSHSWGYTLPQKVRLARQWGSAATSCLQLGDFASKFHINSVQAIINMHTSEHLVGSTKEWAVYQGAATIIARGLGLHRLVAHPDDGKSTGLSQAQKDALLQREMGRRVWCAITSQDWLCSTSQGMYTIQRKHFTSIKPHYLNEDTMTPITDDTPTVTHVGNYLNEISYVLINYHDEILDVQDIMDKYNVVLKYDAKMRALCAEKIPSCLSPTMPFNPAWPRWVAWARRLHQASCAHKIIMLHQAFLGRSFKSPQFTYSRWACVSSAKTIIEHMSKVREPHEPQWWVEQAFVVTAGLCIAIDFFHRSERDPEVREQQMWIEKTIRTLEQWPSSSVASHGVRLLISLLQEHNRKTEMLRPNAPHAPSAPVGPSMPFPSNISPSALADNAAASAEAEAEASSIASEGWGAFDVDMYDFEGFEDLMETLPLEAGLDNNMFFDSMLSIANSQLF
ncbi:MFS general substrate transporter [Pleomassaria siparia CBS 279.74]|uniref:MFS general substrate transporter n=1 Tax=Pleomassaria siparia CBS 279.74 TaxID=1314801 RepID=A0A6G1KB62_9PLEO|nr:MFS general substrate transporter [Pleomassaria siparia CBS 279.74]